MEPHNSIFTISYLAHTIRQSYAHLFFVGTYIWIADMGVGISTCDDGVMGFHHNWITG